MAGGAHSIDSTKRLSTSSVAGTTSVPTLWLRRTSARSPATAKSAATSQGRCGAREAASEVRLCPTVVKRPICFFGCSLPQQTLLSSTRSVLSRSTFNNSSSRTASMYGAGYNCLMHSVVFKALSIASVQTCDARSMAIHSTAVRSCSLCVVMCSPRAALMPVFTASVQASRLVEGSSGCDWKASAILGARTSGTLGMAEYMLGHFPR
mmetsp:Transcript_130074/g.277844  ORF Transcript_130074/g.277844 Transcript_130074/m.277844 type:complete len:208 (+) Transcript_130074:91-714(+)